MLAGGRARIGNTRTRSTRSKFALAFENPRSCACEAWDRSSNAAEKSFVILRPDE